MTRPEDLLANRLVAPLGLKPLSGKGERLFYGGTDMTTSPRFRDIGGGAIQDVTLDCDVARVAVDVLTAKDAADVTRVIIEALEAYYSPAVQRDRQSRYARY